MKIRITMRPTRSLFTAIETATGDNPREYETAWLAADKWFDTPDAYLTVELDTELGTCVVVPV